MTRIGVLISISNFMSFKEPSATTRESSLFWSGLRFLFFCLRFFYIFHFLFCHALVHAGMPFPPIWFLITLHYMTLHSLLIQLPNVDTSTAFINSVKRVGFFQHLFCQKLDICYLFFSYLHDAAAPSHLSLSTRNSVLLAWPVASVFCPVQCVLPATEEIRWGSDVAFIFGKESDFHT